MRTSPRSWLISGPFRRDKSGTSTDCLRAECPLSTQSGRSRKINPGGDVTTKGVVPLRSKHRAYGYWVATGPNGSAVDPSFLLAAPAVAPAQGSRLVLR